MADDQACTNVDVHPTGQPMPPVLQEPSLLLDLDAAVRLQMLEYALSPASQEYHVCKQYDHVSPPAQKIDDIKCAEYNRKSSLGILLDDQICTNVDVHPTGQPVPPVLQEPSPLLDLTAEIRLQILEYALPPAGQEHHVCKQYDHVSPPAQKIDDIKCAEYNRKSCPGILLVNKQMYNESLEFICAVKGFSFCSPTCMRIFLEESNREHMHQTSNLYCQQIVVSGPTVTTFVEEDLLRRARRFIVAARTINTLRYTADVAWDRRLSIDTISVSSEGDPTFKWTLSLSRTSASDLEQDRTSQETSHITFATEGKDVAAVPVANGMVLYKTFTGILRWLSEKAFVGDEDQQFSPFKEVMPLCSAKYLLL